MLFSKRIPIPVKNKQKGRTFRYFKFFNLKKKFFRLISLINFRLFINNVKLLNFFLRKSISKFRRGSRKEYYKKLNEKDNRIKLRIKDEKQILKRFSLFRVLKNKWYLQKLKLKKFYLNKYRRIHNNYICFNSKKLPFSRKSTNSRMGKGKGNIKNWFIQITSGRILFYLIRWNTSIALFVLKIIKMYLPGKSIIDLPFLKKKKYLFYKSYFNLN